MNQELLDVQVVFSKGRETRDKIFNICCVIGKAREFWKTSTSVLLTARKPLTMWITNCGRFLKRLGIPDHLTCLLRSLYAGQEATFRTRHGTMDWFQLEKDYVKAVYCHPAYLTYMQSTSCKVLGWMKHKLESRLPGEISITLDMQMRPLLW